MKRGRRAVSAALLLLAATVAGCGEATRRPPEPPRAGDPLPDLTFARAEGSDSLSLADLTGRPALINMWATWCPPCRAEIPFLQSLHEEYGPRGLRVVGISADNAGALDQVHDFLAGAGVTYENVLDPRSRSLDAFHLLGLPATYLVGADGRIALVRAGPVSEQDERFMAAIEALVSDVEGDAAP